SRHIDRLLSGSLGDAECKQWLDAETANSSTGPHTAAGQHLRCCADHLVESACSLDGQEACLACKAVIVWEAHRIQPRWLNAPFLANDILVWPQLPRLPHERVVDLVAKRFVGFAWGIKSMLLFPIHAEHNSDWLREFGNVASKWHDPP